MNLDCCLYRKRRNGIVKRYKYYFSLSAGIRTLSSGKTFRDPSLILLKGLFSFKYVKCCTETNGAVSLDYTQDGAKMLYCCVHYASPVQLLMPKAASYYTIVRFM